MGSVTLTSGHANISDLPSEKLEISNKHDAYLDYKLGGGSKYTPPYTQPQTHSKAWMAGAALLWVTAAAGCAMSVYVALAPPLLVSVAVFSALVLAGVVIFTVCREQDPIANLKPPEEIKRQAKQAGKDEEKLDQLQRCKYKVTNPNTSERDIPTIITKMIELLREDWATEHKKQEGVKEFCEACKTVIDNMSYRNERAKEVLEKMLALLKNLKKGDSSRHHLEKVTLQLVLKEISASNSRVSGEEERCLRVLVEERTHNFENFVAEIMGPHGLTKSGTYYQKTLEFLHQKLQKQPPCEDVEKALATLEERNISNASTASAQQLSQGLPKTITIFDTESRSSTACTS